MKSEEAHRFPECSTPTGLSIWCVDLKIFFVVERVPFVTDCFPFHSDSKMRNNIFRNSLLSLARESPPLLSTTMEEEAEFVRSYQDHPEDASANAADPFCCGNIQVIGSLSGISLLFHLMWLLIVFVDNSEEDECIIYNMRV